MDFYCCLCIHFSVFIAGIISRIDMECNTSSKLPYHFFYYYLNSNRISQQQQQQTNKNEMKLCDANRKKGGPNEEFHFRKYEKLQMTFSYFYKNTFLLFSCFSCFVQAKWKMIEREREKENWFKKHIRI